MFIITIWVRLNSERQHKHIRYGKRVNVIIAKHLCYRSCSPSLSSFSLRKNPRFSNRTSEKPCPYGTRFNRSQFTVRSRAYPITERDSKLAPHWLIGPFFLRHSRYETGKWPGMPSPNAFGRIPRQTDADKVERPCRPANGNDGYSRTTLFAT